MIAVAAFVTVALLVMLITVLHNWWAFPRLAALPLAATPAVSILIPCRNEAHTIGRTISAWRAQTYENFELLVLDDHSDDGTATVAQAAAADDPRV
ncbi:MAG: glycosyltransferase, partial [Caldilineaceae bacterium]|nr:glycosyltransferase [Caldilineaceae bacterium]